VNDFIALGLMAFFSAVFYCLGVALERNWSGKA